MATNDTTEAIEARRAARREAAAAARAEQERVDLHAIDALEEKGAETLHTMTAGGYKVGVPVRIAFRPPTAPQYTRYKDQVNRAADKKDPGARIAAQELLAESCWVYPEDADARAAVRDAFPGTLISLAIEVVKFVEMQSEEEKKG